MQKGKTSLFIVLLINGTIDCMQVINATHMRFLITISNVQHGGSWATSRIIDIGQRHDNIAIQSGQSTIYIDRSSLLQAAHLPEPRSWQIPAVLAWGSTLKLAMQGNELVGIFNGKIIIADVWDAHQRALITNRVQEPG